MKNKTILILSPEDWGTNLLSKHLYAQELSKNNTVFFLHTSSHPKQKNFITSTKVGDRITLLRLNRVVKGIFKLPKFTLDFQAKLIVKKILAHIDQPIDVLWSFDQTKFQDLNQFKAKQTIFHPVDLIEKAKPFLTRISNSADVVLSVSQKILDQIDTSTPKYFINHGLSTQLLNMKSKLSNPGFIQRNKVNIGYVGNLQMKLIDWNALLLTVKQNSSIHFVFIGPDGKSNIGGQKKFNQLDEIKRLPNTTFTGEMSKGQLHDVLPCFDGFLICYNHAEYPIKVSNSHKILEYLCTGKVIVSNYISTYDNIELLEMVENNSDLSDKLKTICDNLADYNQPERCEKRIAFARDNTYEKQIARIERLLN